MSSSNIPSQAQNDNNGEEQTIIIGDKSIDLRLQFGEDGGQDELLSLKANCFSYISSNILQKQRDLLKEIQSKDEVNSDTLLVFKFEVETGRQRQSLQFIQKGLDQDKQNENTSAMQKLFHRPKTTGRIQLKQGKGYIYIIYRFYAEMIENHIGDLMKFVQSQIDFTFNLNMIMKGSTQPSKRTFTAVKPDYFLFKLQSKQLSIKDFLNFLQQGGQIPEQQINTQYYQLLKNLQIAQFYLKFNSVRQIMRYYYRCLYGDNEQEDQHNKDYRELPLLNKGIFKNSVTVNLVLANKLAIEMEAKYKSQEVMLRLIARFTKIYQTA